MATRMQQRRGTAAEWAASNIILGNGEIGFSKDTLVIKMGDGVTAWNSLPAAFITRSADGATGDIVVRKADATDGRLPRGSTGQQLTVQANGTLAWENAFAIVDQVGDLIVGSGADTAARLPMGTAGQQLKVSSAGAVAWETPPVTDLSSRVPLALFDAVGDFLVGTGNDTAGKLTAGTVGQVLTMVAGSPTWVTPVSSSVGFAELFMHGGN